MCNVVNPCCTFGKAAQHRKGRKGIGGVVQVQFRTFQPAPHDAYSFFLHSYHRTHLFQVPGNRTVALDVISVQSFQQDVRPGYCSRHEKKSGGTPISRYCLFKRPVLLAALYPEVRKAVVPFIENPLFIQPLQGHLYVRNLMDIFHVNLRIIFRKRSRYQQGRHELRTHAVDLRPAPLYPSPYLYGGPAVILQRYPVRSQELQGIKQRLDRPCPQGRIPVKNNFKIPEGNNPCEQVHRSAGICQVQRSPGIVRHAAETLNRPVIG